MTYLSEKETDVYDALLSSLEKLREIAHNIAGDKTNGDDALQELMVVLFDKDKDKLNKIYKTGGLLWYCIRTLNLMLNSKNSRYYYKYNKYYEHVNGNVSIDNISNTYYSIPTTTNRLLEKIDDIINELYWYDKELFKLYYYTGSTLHGLAEQTGISRTSIFNTIKRVKLYIKKRINETYKI